MAIRTIFRSGLTIGPVVSPSFAFGWDGGAPDCWRAPVTVVLSAQYDGERDHGRDRCRGQRRAGRGPNQSPRAPKPRRGRDEFLFELWDPGHYSSRRARSVPSPRLTRLRTTASEQRKSFAISG